MVASLAAALPAQLQFEELGQPLPVDPAGAFSLAMGDVDGDGDLDMICGQIPGERLYKNDGHGRFTDVTATHMPANGGWADGLVLGDVDGDGDLDLVVAVSWQSRLYRNDGSGVFTEDTSANLITGAKPPVALGDVDGDGDLDLVFGGRGYNYGWQSQLYLNDGSGAFSEVTASQLPVDSDLAMSVALADFDGDGDLDIVFGNSPEWIFPYSWGGQDRLYLNDGVGNFTDVTGVSMPADGDGTNAVLPVDVDGDGDLDMVFGRPGQDRLYRNSGAGVFTDVTAASLPIDNDWTLDLAVGDVDGDGDVDLVAGNGHTEPIRLSLNDGSGGFVDATAGRLPVDTSLSASVELGDVDGDGDLDLAVMRSGQNRLYVNLLRQLAAASPPQLGQSYTLDVYARYGAWHAFDVALPYLSLAPASVAVPGLGTIGIDITQAAPLPPLLIPQPAGIASTSFLIPNNAALVGVELFAQAAHVPFPQPARLTNATRGVVQ